MAAFNRRDFLKILGLAGSMATMGCDMLFTHYVPYIDSPRDIVPGEPVWFATTCRECPAGCGMLANNRDRRIIKVEGNPVHPINHGKLCPRGQASLHGLYNPDRYRQPMQRDQTGALHPISWNDAFSILAGQVADLMRQGKGGNIAFMTELMNGTLQDLASFWLSETGGGQHIRYHAYAYEPLRKANEIVFGQAQIPIYPMQEADFLISFGAGFLETWVSNVAYACAFAKFHAPKGQKKNFFVYVGPRHSMTAANADHQIIVPPGDEYLIALAILRAMVEKHPPQKMARDQLAAIQSMVQPFDMEEIALKTGADAASIDAIARRWSQAEKPLALAEGLALAPNALETAVAANLLQSTAPQSHAVIDFGRASALGESATAADLKALSERMDQGGVDIFMVHDANPVFTLPPSLKFAERLQKVPLVVSFSSAEDETSRLAHLILPTHTPLESWGDYVPQAGIHDLLQPVMGTLHNTRHLGDILLELGKRIKGAQTFSSPDFYHVLLAAWQNLHDQVRPKQGFNDFWLEAAKAGGFWQQPAPAAPSQPPKLVEFKFPPVRSAQKGSEEFYFTAYPTIQFYDGRMANRWWIQELPDPMTQTTWGGWVEMHPDDAAARGLERGRMITLQSPHGQVDVPVIPIFTVPRGTLAMPIGQGHTHYGRFASGLPANPLMLYGADVASQRSGPSLAGFTVTLRKKGDHFPIAHTDGKYYDLDREIVQEIAFATHLRESEAGKRPEVDLPLPEGYHPDKDIYPPHVHGLYRWCMVVDLDRCIGCGACVVACYAENNVAVVGRQAMLFQREMSWIRVQRYFKENQSHKARFLVMLCQHCDEAPCEAVCPVFAPHHDIEGLNEQVYNRCIGTRDCSQNDPYKVRRFNWYTFNWPKPLNYQLNPDVTVRMKGVMEKCSFCVQRIVRAKINATRQGRLVRDDDFTTACAQTCPTDALVFGSLLNPESRVSKLVGESRAYQVFRHLNTKPAAIYLKKLVQEL